MPLVSTLFKYLCASLLAPAAQGGICAKNTAYSGIGGNTYKSLNTGIVTLENYQKRVPLAVSFITFAHEIGHNFGSQVLSIVHPLIDRNWGN